MDGPIAMDPASTKPEKVAGRAPALKWFALGILGLLAILTGIVWLRVSGSQEVATIHREIDAGNLPKAESLLKTLQQKSPNSAETAFLLARMSMARDRPSEVLQHLKRARELGHPEPPMNRLVGLIQARAGNPRTAEPLLLASWTELPGPDPDVADALCRIYVQSFRFDPALTVLDRWLKQNPDDLRAWLWRAEVHSRNDPGLDVQIRDYDEVLRRAPDHLGSRLGRANALRLVGRLHDAQADYDVYLKARPDDPEALFGAAKTAEGLDEESDALAFYERILQVIPDDVRGLLGKSAILVNRKDFLGALALLDVAIRHVPNDPEPHYRRGQALERLGRSDEARKEFAERKRLQSDQEKIENIRKGLVRNPNDFKLMSEATAWLLDHGYEEQGLEWAKKTLDAQPDHVPTLERLAEMHQKKGNVGLANFYRSQLRPSP